MTYSLEYYNQSVEDDILEWPVDLLADYTHLSGLLIELGPELKMPHSKALGKGLFELRPKAASGIGRAFYCFLMGKKIVVVHAFIKKTQKTPEKELKLARKRVKELKNGRH
jgi:phage-related protein